MASVTARSVISLISAPLALAVVLTSPAHAATGCDWSAPVQLSGTDEAGLPTVAAGLPGSAAVNYYNFGDPVRVFTSDGRVSTDLGKASSQPSPTMRPQLIATDQNSRGQAISVFAERTATQERVYAALRGADGVWQSRIPLSQRGAYGFYPQVAIDERGRAVVVWTQNTSKGGTVIAGRTINAKGSRGPLFQLGNGESADPVVAVGTDRTIAVAWDEIAVTSNPVWSAVSTNAGRDWSKATLVSEQLASTDNKSIDIADSGRIGLVWDQEQGANSSAVQVVAASTKRDNSWIDPVALTKGDHLSINGGIATGGTDEFTVAWITGPTNGLPGRNVLKVASGFAIDKLGTPKRIDVSTDPVELQRAHVAVNAQGIAAISWERDVVGDPPPPGVPAGIMAVVRTQGRWQAPQKLRGWRATPAYSQIGIDSAGGLTVAWDETRGETTSVAMAQCAAGPVR